MKLEYSLRVFERYSNTKFHENSSSGSRVVPCGRTDRQDKANSRFEQFRESAQQKCEQFQPLAQHYNKMT